MRCEFAMFSVLTISLNKMNIGTS
uniref:Uncharacterized protein n=1 Tax=Tetranychus urticae TaxID=32264 RepID=T1KLE4_TETUR